MRGIRSLIGLPVVVSGKKIGRVVQPELSDDLTRAEGIWVDAGLCGTRFIESDRIRLIGDVAITADDAGKRKSLQSRALFRRAIGTDGCRLGAITGAEIDPLSFRIEALELSLGLWNDLLSGRERVSLFTVDRQSGNVIVERSLPERRNAVNEEWNGERIDHGRADRRFRCGGLRDHELADGEADEPPGS